jgi:hypothetical protein
VLEDTDSVERIAGWGNDRVVHDLEADGVNHVVGYNLRLQLADVTIRKKPAKR